MIILLLTPSIVTINTRNNFTTYNLFCQTKYYCILYLNNYFLQSSLRKNINIQFSNSPIYLLTIATRKIRKLRSQKTAF